MSLFKLLACQWPCSVCSSENLCPPETDAWPPALVALRLFPFSFCRSPVGASPRPFRSFGSCDGRSCLVFPTCLSLVALVRTLLRKVGVLGWDGLGATSGASAEPRAVAFRASFARAPVLLPVLGPTLWSSCCALRHSRAWWLLTRGCQPVPHAHLQSFLPSSLFPSCPFAPVLQNPFE